MPREPNPLIQWRVYYGLLEERPVRLDAFDNTMGSPADAQAYRDHAVLAVFQKQFGGTLTERIVLANQYAFLDLHEKWNETTEREIAEYRADGVSFSAELNGGNFPQEIFQTLYAFAETDIDFPSADGPISYGKQGQLNFAAAVRREWALEDGIPVVFDRRT